MVTWPVCGALTCPCLYARLVHYFDFEGLKEKWTTKTQGKFQVFGLLLTLAMALLGGTIVGE